MRWERASAEDVAIDYSAGTASANQSARRMVIEWWGVEIAGKGGKQTKSTADFSGINDSKT